MKHRSMTPLRWLSRLPGRIYRNKAVRFAFLWIAGYEVAFQIAWRVAGKPDHGLMNEFAWVCAIAIYLALVAFTWGIHLRSKTYWREGHEKYDMALAALTMAKHGHYKSRPVKVNGEAQHDLVCACGVYVGSVAEDRPEDAFPFIERHADEKLKELHDEVERKTRAASGSR